MRHHLISLKVVRESIVEAQNLLAALGSGGPANQNTRSSCHRLSVELAQAVQSIDRIAKEISEANTIAPATVAGAMKKKTRRKEAT